MADDLWIVVPKWDEFQHYTDGRRLKWIKTWTNLLDNDDYLGLSFHLRGVLHSLWVAYASAEGQLKASPQSLHRQLGHSVKKRDLESLNHAGFIRFSGTKPARIRTVRSREEEEKKSSQNPKGKPTGAMSALKTLIANGAIRDTVDLDSELRSGDHHITTEHRDELIAMLETAEEAA